MRGPTFGSGRASDTNLGRLATTRRTKGETREERAAAAAHASLPCPSVTTRCRHRGKTTDRAPLRPSFPQALSPVRISGRGLGFFRRCYGTGPRRGRGASVPSRRRCLAHGNRQVPCECPRQHQRRQGRSHSNDRVRRDQTDSALFFSRAPAQADARRQVPRRRRPRQRMPSLPQ